MAKPFEQIKSVWTNHKLSRLRLLKNTVLQWIDPKILQNNHKNNPNRVPFNIWTSQPSLNSILIILKPRNSKIHTFHPKIHVFHLKIHIFQPKIKNILNPLTSIAIQWKFLLELLLRPPFHWDWTPKPTPHFFSSSNLHVF